MMEKMTSDACVYLSANYHHVHPVSCAASPENVTIIKSYTLIIVLTCGVRIFASSLCGSIFWRGVWCPASDQQCCAGRGWMYNVINLDKHPAADIRHVVEGRLGCLQLWSAQG